MGEQLAFDLPHRPALGADDFLVSDCNSLAVRLIDVWPQWPSPANFIVGPPGSGKTHLANVWSLKSEAISICPDSRGAFDLGGLAEAKAVVIEDLDRAKIDEASLFHLLNTVAERRMSLLLTGREPATQWDVALPDLISRLRAIPVVAIGSPDDMLLRAVLLKHFSDRQLEVDPAVIAFLGTRMERSMDAARQLVALMDVSALGARRRITRPFAAEILSKLQREPTGEQ